jgi:hypothetical protein
MRLGAKESSKPIGISFFPQSAGLQLAEMLVISNDSCRNGRHSVALKGIGDKIPQDLQLCLPEEVNFGRVALRDSSYLQPPVTITNCGDVTVEIKSITTTNNEFRAIESSATVLPAKSFPLTLMFKPAVVGIRQGQAVLHVEAGNLETDFTIRLIGEAYVKGQPKVTVRPNPFTPNGDGINDQTVFDFSSFDISHPTLKLFNIAGRLIRSLEPSRPRQEFYWDGLDDDAQLVPPGLFIYIIEEDGRKIESGHVAMVR